MKRFFSLVSLSLLLVLMTGLLSAAAPGPAPAPVTKFTLVSGLPATMSPGESQTVVILIESEEPFNSATAMPSAFFPGRGVSGNQGDHASAGTSALLEVTFTAKASPDKFSGPYPVSVFAAARYANGVNVVQQYDFVVSMP